MEENSPTINQMIKFETKTEYALDPSSNLTPLEEEDCLREELYPGYELVADRGLFMETGEGQIPILISREYRLICRGQEIMTVVFDSEVSKEEAVNSVINEIAKREGETVRQIILQNVVHRPPWDRKTPVRKYRRYTPEKAFLTLNERGNADRFEEECRGWLIYDRLTEKWYAWNLTHWEPAGEKLGKAERFVASSIEEELTYWKKRLAHEEETGGKGTASAQELKRLVAAFTSHYTTSSHEHGLNAMANISAKSNLSMDFKECSSADLLACKNAVINCRTGQVSGIAEAESLKEQYPVHYVDCTYEKDTRPKLFLEHLDSVFLDNTAEQPDYTAIDANRDLLKEYFCRLLGYSLYPGNPRNIIVFFWGTGANGKSTTISAVRKVLGPEFVEAASAELLADRDNKPKSGIAQGLSKRILYFSEAADDDNPRGPKLSSERIKNLTGDDASSAFRDLYAKSLSQDIMCLPIAATNELPNFDKSLDRALLRRIITLPFPHEFTEKSRNLQMNTLLHKERDAIFSLMVDNLLCYLKNEDEEPGSGLPPLPKICEDTLVELIGDGKFAPFIKLFEKTDGSKPELLTTQEELKRLFIIWCEKKGVSISYKPTVADVCSDGVIKEKDLTIKDVKQLYGAFRAAKFREKKSGPVRYFCCRLVGKI